MKNIKKMGALILASLVIALAAITPAYAAIDFTNVTAAVDSSTIVAAITAIAAIKMLPGVAKWGFNKVIGWFR